TRLLGCAPMASLRCHSCSGARGARAVLALHRAGHAVGGPMLRAHHGLKIRAPSAVHTWVTDFDGENLRGGAINESELREGRPSKSSCFCFPAQPNEMRLSCGARWTISQTDGLPSKTATPASRAC